MKYLNDIDNFIYIKEDENQNSNNTEEEKNEENDITDEIISDEQEEKKETPPVENIDTQTETNSKPEEQVNEEEPPSIEDEVIDEEPKEEVEEPKKEEIKEIIPQKKSFPQMTDEEEKDKNGVRRKKLYIAFIEWAKEYNPKNTFGSIFDKDIFHNVYTFVPHDMRYFYRLANPILCVLAGSLTFFQCSELKKLNAKNPNLAEMMIFAATKDNLRVFSNRDKKVYLGMMDNNRIKLTRVLGNTFDTYLQSMIKKGDILNGPIDDDKENTNSEETKE